jgi:hypothetical protein
VQHALVAVRGAAGDPATVRLRYLGAALELEIRGRPAEEAGGDVAVLAARERVTAHGGRFTAESTNRGARVLRAHLPLAAAGV